MSREILFRAKRTDNGKWVEGFYVRHIKRQVCPFGDSLKPEDEEHFICFDGFADWNMPRELMCTEIDPKTLCQYTELVDKNGKKIYENDIVKIRFENHDGALNHYEYQNMGIAWDNEYLRWIYADKHGATDALGYCLSEHLEIVGNIFDNPELLEV